MRVDRLLNEAAYSIDGDEVVKYRVGIGPAVQNNRHRRTLRIGSQRADERRAGCRRHREIGQDEVDPTFVQAVERFIGAGGLKHDVTRWFEQRRSEETAIRVIVDYQNRRHAQTLRRFFLSTCYVTLVHRLVHALECALAEKWDEAQNALEDADEPAARKLRMLFERLRPREEDRAIALSGARHALGNLLTVAQANVEGMLDGIVSPTPERLENVRKALTEAAGLCFAETLETRYRDQETAKRDARE